MLFICSDRVQEALALEGIRSGVRALQGRSGHIVDWERGSISRPAERTSRLGVLVSCRG